MSKKTANNLILLVKIMDIVNLILGILAIVQAVFVLISPDERIGLIPNVLLFAGIMNILMSIKLYLRDEYHKFFITLIVGGVILILGIVLKVALS